MSWFVFGMRRRCQEHSCVRASELNKALLLNPTQADSKTRGYQPHEQRKSHRDHEVCQGPQAMFEEGQEQVGTDSASCVLSMWKSLKSAPLAKSKAELPQNMSKGESSSSGYCSPTSADTKGTIKIDTGAHDGYISTEFTLKGLPLCAG